MAVIQANTSLTLTVPAGFRLQFGTPVSGTCTVTLPDRVLTENLTDGEGMGPYQADASMTILSTVASTCYTIRRDGVTAILQSAHLAQVPYLPGVSVLIGESAAGPALPAGWSGSAFQALVSGAGKAIGASVFNNQLASGTASAGAATTYEQLRWTKARKPIAGRLRYRHNRTTSPHAPLQFMVGSVASATGAAQNLVAVTWAGAAVVPATAVSAATVEQDLVSDIFPITAVDRSDSFAGYILALRTLVPIDASTGVFSYSNLAINSGVPNSTGLKCMGTRQQAGDFVTSNTAGFTTTTYSGGSVSVVDIELFYETGPNDIFMMGGDSVTTGEFSTTGYSGWARMAIDILQAAGKNVDYWNAGWGAQTSRTNLNAVKQVAALVKPGHCGYSPFSSNDGAASATLLAQNKAQAIEFVEFCRANGIRPYLVTPSPNNARDSALATHMSSLTSWLIGYCASVGIGCINLGAAMGSAADNTLFATGYDATDGVGGKHPNDAGYTAGSIAAAAVLANYIT